MTRRPLVAPALALIAGSALAPLCPAVFAPFFITLAALFLASALALRRPRLLLVTLALWPPIWSSLTRLPPPNWTPREVSLIEARVLSVDRILGRGARLKVALRSCEGRPCRGRYLLYTRDAERWVAGELLRARVRRLERARRPSLAALAAPALIHTPAVSKARRWLRGRLRAGLAELDPEAAGFLESVTVGSRERLTPRVRALLRRTGTGHLLSVSGLHVGLVAAALLFSLRLTPFSPKGRAALALLGVAVYVVLTGARPASVRAGVLLSGLLGAGLLRRFYEPWNLLALGACLLLLGEPERLYDPGCQLSFAIVGALIAASSALRRLPGLAPRGGTVRRAAHRIAQSFGVAGVAFAAGAPIALARFGQVALAGPLANPPALPIFAALLALALLGLALSLIAPALGAPPLYAAAGLTQALFAMLETIESVAPSPLRAEPESLLRSPLLLGASSLTIALSLIGHWRRAAICALISLALALSSVQARPPSNVLESASPRLAPAARTVSEDALDPPLTEERPDTPELELHIERGRCELILGGRPLESVAGAPGPAGAAWTQLATGLRRLELGGQKVLVVEASKELGTLAREPGAVLVMAGRPPSRAVLERVLEELGPRWVFFPRGWPRIEGPWVLQRGRRHRILLWPWLELRSPPAEDRAAMARRTLEAWWRG